MTLAAFLAAVALVPVAGAVGFVVAPSSPTDGLARVQTDVKYVWVVTAGEFKGQTTDPAYVLKTKKKDRPPARFERITCYSYADRFEAPTLTNRAVRVCDAQAVSEAEVRRALR